MAAYSISEMEAQDPFHRNVVLLMPIYAGVIADLSPARMTPVLAGPTIAASTAQIKNGTHSIALNSLDQVTFSKTMCPVLTTRDFTIELWVYLTIDTAMDLVEWADGTTSQWILMYRPGGIIAFYAGPISDVARVTTATSAVTINSWTHIAVVRTGLVVQIFIGGVAATLTGTNGSGSFGGGTGAGVLRIPGTFGVTGFMDDIRITVGTARYSSTFTPPTEPPWLSNASSPGRAEPRLSHLSTPLTTMASGGHPKPNQLSGQKHPAPVTFNPLSGAPKGKGRGLSGQKRPNTTLHALTDPSRAKGLPEKSTRYMWTPPTFSGPPSRYALPGKKTHSPYFGGTGTISGTVSTHVPPDVYTQARVLLVDDATKFPVEDTVSDPVTGAYSFTQLSKTRTFSVIAYHPTGAYSAVIADRQVPV